MKSNHEKLHKEFKCKYCPLIFMKKENREAHIQSLHNDSHPYQCSECSFKSKRRDRLLFHLRNKHRLEKPLKCSHPGCSYVSNDHRIMSKHKRQHSLIKRYVCSKCSYASHQKGNLVRHMRVRHSLERPFACDKCTFKTAHKYSLKLHKLSCLYQ
jgi:KRAB domain-containing zinc finger protein